MKLLLTIFTLILFFLMSCKEKEKQDNVKYNLQGAIALYDSADYSESVVILDSLLKKDTVSCKAYLLIVLNNIKLNRFIEAKKSIEKYNHSQKGFEKDKYYDVLGKLETELDYTISTGETHSMQIVADLIYTMLDSVELVNKAIKGDSTSVYEITIQE